MNHKPTHKPPTKAEQVELLLKEVIALLRLVEKINAAEDPPKQVRVVTSINLVRVPHGHCHHCMRVHVGDCSVSHYVDHRVADRLRPLDR